MTPTTSRKRTTRVPRTLPPLPLTVTRLKPRSYEEWSALARWKKLPPWEPLRPGFLLRAAREEAGVTQAELAAKLGVSQQAVAQAERVNSNPSVAFVASWTRSLGTHFTFGVGDRR